MVALIFNRFRLEDVMISANLEIVQIADIY